MDEVALYEHSDVEEFKSRTKSFEGLGRKIFIVSSPMYEGDPIQMGYNNSYCKKELHIVCKKCNKSFYPTSKHFRYMTEKEYKEINPDKFNELNYKRTAIETARVVCECGNDIYYKDLEDYVRNNRVKLKIIEGNHDKDRKIGYRLNALATGLTDYSYIAEKLIEAKGDEQKLVAIYREYLNETYEKKDKEVISSDVTLLNSNYDEFVVPDDTAAIYMGTDTQKGYYWSTIVAFKYGMSPHRMWAGRVEDEDTLETLMDRDYYYKDGRKWNKGINRAGQDWQGYREYKENVNEETGEVTHETVMDMPQRVKEFAFKMADKYGADKDGRERYYATRGEEFLPNDDFFRFTNLEVESKNFRDTRKIKTLKLGTIALKSSFMTTLMRSIAKTKATDEDEAYHYENRLFTINKTQCDKMLLRDKVNNKDIDMQLTSEAFGYARTPSGKPKKYKSWNKVRDDNHYLDCMVICYALAIMDNIQSLKKPEKEKETSVKDIISGLI